MQPAEAIGKAGGVFRLESGGGILIVKTMAVVHKSILLGYSADQTFALVDKGVDYPSFLPWCGQVDVRERRPDRLVAAITIDYHGIKLSFTTENSNTPQRLCK